MKLNITFLRLKIVILKQNFRKICCNTVLGDLLFSFTIPKRVPWPLNGIFKKFLNIPNLIFSTTNSTIRMLLIKVKWHPIEKGEGISWRGWGWGVNTPLKVVIFKTGQLRSFANTCWKLFGCGWQFISPESEY